MIPRLTIAKSTAGDLACSFSGLSNTQAAGSPAAFLISAYKLCSTCRQASSRLRRRRIANTIMAMPATAPIQISTWPSTEYIASKDLP